MLGYYISTVWAACFVSCTIWGWCASGYVLYDYSTANTVFVANPGNATTKNLVVNSNGSSIIVIYDGVNQAYLSHDNGTTWSSLEAVISTSTQLVVGSMSATGQYMYLAGYASNSSARVHISSDYGATWTLSSYTPAASSSPIAINTDVTGQYVVLSTQEKRILLSSDYGAAFTSIYTGVTAVGDVVVTTNGYIYFCDTVNVYRGTLPSLSFAATKGISSLCLSLSVSSDGAYVYVSDGLSLYSSSNYGNTWSTFDGVSSNGVHYPYVNVAYASSDGSIIAMTVYRRPTTYPAVSTNFGATWRVMNPEGTQYSDAIRITGSGSAFYLTTQPQASQEGLYVIAGVPSIVASPTAAPSPSPAPSPSSATESDGNSGTASAQVIAAAVIGSVGGLVVAGFAIYVIYWKFFVSYSLVTSDSAGIALQP